MAYLIALLLTTGGVTTTRTQIEAVPLVSAPGHIPCEAMARKHDAAWYYFAPTAAGYACISAGGTFVRGTDTITASCPPIQEAATCGVTTGPFHNQGVQVPVMDTITDACAPRVLAADAAAAGIDRVWTGDYTAIISHWDDPAQTLATILGHSGLNAGANMRASTSTFVCQQGDGSTLTSVTVSSSGAGRWNTSSCSYDGTNLWARRNGISNSGVVAAGAAPSVTLYLGRGNAVGRSTQGPYGPACILSEFISADDYARTESIIHGGGASTRNVTVARTTPAYIVVGDKVEAIGQNLPAVTGDGGISVSRAVTNAHDTGCNAAAAPSVWTAIGSPTVTPAHGAGPGSNVCGRNDVTLISGDTGEGISSPALTSTVDLPYTYSLLAHEDDAVWTFRVDEATVGATDCAISGATCTGAACGDVTAIGASGWHRFTCTRAASGTGNAMTGQALLASDASTLRVSLPQFEQAARAGRVCVDFSGAAATCAADWPVTVPNGGVPTREFSVYFEAAVDVGPVPAFPQPNSRSTFIDLGGVSALGGFGWLLRRVEGTSNVGIRARGTDNTVFSANSSAVAWATTGTNRFCVSFISGRVYVRANGALVLDAAIPEERRTGWYTGNAFGVGGTVDSYREENALNGTISSLRWYSTPYCGRGAP